MSHLQLAHYGLRSQNVERSIEWYEKVLGARVNFKNDLLVFMSFDEEHHRLVIWDDGDTVDKAPNGEGVDHVGFSCDGPAELADEFSRLKKLGITPNIAVNHGFTSSLYYEDPDGNEVELTCDNFPTKAECEEFMRTPAMAEVVQPPTFGFPFDPEHLLKLRQSEASAQELSRIGLAAS